MKRTDADVRAKKRCKLSVIAEAVSDCSEAIPSSELRYKYNDYFYPPNAPEVDDEGTPKKKRKTAGRQFGLPYVAVNVNPKAKPVRRPSFVC